MGFELSDDGAAEIPIPGGSVSLIRCDERTWRVAGAERPRAAAAARAVADWVRECRAELMERERPDRTAWLHALQSAGLVVARRKLLVDRRLDDPPAPPMPAGVGWRSLAVAGAPAFRRVHSDVLASDAYIDDDVESEWRTCVAQAGELHDPSIWRLAQGGDEVVGLIMPNRYPDAPEEGTVSYIGVLPAHRGKGWGWRLHAAALHLLAAAGAKRYIGSTDVRNVAMRRVFERNDCRELGVRVFLGRPRGGTGS